MNKKIITLKEVVKEVLEENQRARNSDMILILCVYRKLGFGIWIEDLKNSPSFESITRARRDLQNTKGILPPTEDIDALRNRRELEFKEVYCGI